MLEPTHVHWGVARAARALMWFDESDEDWRQIRVGAELAARMASGGAEVEMDDIYDRVRSQLGCSEATIRRLRDLELSVEYTLSTPIRAACVAANSESVDQGRRIFVSDTYLGRDDIAQLLAKASLSCDPESIYVSSEFGASKARGDLFSVVAAHRGLQCDEVAHVGDNYTSDVLNARRAGWTARQVKAPRPNIYEQILHAHGGNNYVSSVIAGAARANRLRYDGTLPANPELTGVSASVAGPILLAYVLWVLCEAEDRGLDRLYFMARDGQILHRLAVAVTEWTGSKIDCRYLLGSRQCFYLSSLPHRYGDAVDAIARCAVGKTVGAVLTELEIEPAAALVPLARVGLDWSTEVASEDTLELLTSMLGDSDIADDLDRRRMKRTNALMAYLGAEGFLTPDLSIGVVDLGWNGNVQLKLERSIAEHSEQSLIGFYYGLNEGYDQSLRGRVLTYSQTPTWHTQILETMCAADHGSIRGFRLAADGSAEPITDFVSDSNAIAWGVRSQQEIILSYAENVLAALNPASVSARELLDCMKPGAMAILARLISRPSRADAEAYGSASHAADQVHQSPIEIAPRLGTLQTVRMLYSKSYRYRITFWPQGVIARSSDKIVVKALNLLMVIRYRIKTSRRPTPPARTG